LSILVVLLDASGACFTTDNPSDTCALALGELLQASRAVIELYRKTARPCALARAHIVFAQFLQPCVTLHYMLGCATPSLIATNLSPGIGWKRFLDIVGSEVLYSCHGDARDVLYIRLGTTSVWVSSAMILHSSRYLQPFFSCEYFPLPEQIYDPCALMFVKATVCLLRKKTCGESCRAS
jgi:hypothetical protein